MVCQGSIADARRDALAYARATAPLATSAYLLGDKNSPTAKFICHKTVPSGVLVGKDATREGIAGSGALQRSNLNARAKDSQALLTD